MKRLDRFVLKSFFLPFLASFSVALFVLVLQFLSKYQNDLFGKGLGWEVLTQIFLYASVQLTVLALPIAMLLSSLSVLGRMGENYELAAMKSAGIPLTRILAPLFFFSLGISALSFYLSSYSVPYANRKLYSLIYNAQQAKPDLALKPGFFDRKFEGFAFYYAKRSKEGMLYDVKIWDHSRSPIKTNLIYADSAQMTLDKKLLFLRLKLFHGQQHEPQPQESVDPSQPDAKPYARFDFDTLLYKFDISSFQMKDLDEEAFKSHQYMQTLPELKASTDSLRLSPAKACSVLSENANGYYRFSKRMNPHPASGKMFMDTSQSVLERFPYEHRSDIIITANNNVRGIKSHIDYSKTLYKEASEQFRRYGIEYWLKYSLPLACVVMLFIGAPLGAIIRKGGIGMPTVVSLGFFVMFYLLLTNGRKFAREGVITVEAGVWMPIIVLGVIALYITRQSTTDSRLFDAGWYRLWWQNVKSFRK